MTTVIGTAGWSIPSQHAAWFAGEGSSALERYASKFRAVEINSSFHRSHRASTWARWADSVPGGFRFSVKMPKAITHERKLADCHHAVERFLEEVAPLGSKLAVLLVQLPPKLEYEAELATSFFDHLAFRSSALLACEPRHPSWFTGEATAFFTTAGVARVAADPPPVPAAIGPGGSTRLRYWRLHGSPQMYYSAYGRERLVELAAALAREEDARREVWCIFDNTAGSAAMGDARLLSELLAKRAVPTPADEKTADRRNYGKMAP
jgi:uncharacterized protein YecE (DUF72 family)